MHHHCERACVTARRGKAWPEHRVRGRLTLISGLEDIAQDRIAYSAETGDVVIEWDTISDIGSSLISTWFLGILRIQDAYGEILII